MGSHSRNVADVYYISQTTDGIYLNLSFVVHATIANELLMFRMERRERYSFIYFSSCNVIIIN